MSRPAAGLSIQNPSTSGRVTIRSSFGRPNVEPLVFGAAQRPAQEQEPRRRPGTRRRRADPSRSPRYCAGGGAGKEDSGANGTGECCEGAVRRPAMRPGLGGRVRSDRGHDAETVVGVPAGRVVAIPGRRTGELRLPEPRPPAQDAPGFIAGRLGAFRVVDRDPPHTARASRGTTRRRFPHVDQPPRVGRLLAHGTRAIARILLRPGDRARIVTAVIERCVRPCAAGIFPLHLGRQRHLAFHPLRQPVSEGVRSRCR